jgi:YVTN family beta-propeller protein
MAPAACKALRGHLQAARNPPVNADLQVLPSIRTTAWRASVEFRVLGPLEVSHNGRMLPLGGAQQRALLAILLLRANQIVSADALVDALWGERPPESFANTVQGYVSRLRKLLSSGEGQVIRYSPPGYVLQVEAEQVDSHRFERLILEATQARAKDDPETAGATLREALALWRGAPLADIVLNSFIEPELRRLEELRLTALEEWIEVKLTLDRRADVVPELEALVAEHPLRERLRGALMLALYRSGRQSEALEVYRDGRRRLVEEIGIEPGRDLRELERAILSQDASLEAPLPLTPETSMRAAGGSRQRRRLLMAGAALAAGGAITVLAVGLTGHSSGMTVPPNAIGVIDPGTNQVIDVVHAGTGPGAIAVGEGAVWVANRDDKTVARLNPRTHELQTISVDGTPSGIAAGKGAVWVAHGFSGTLERIDPHYNQVAEGIPVLPSSAAQTSTIAGTVATGPGPVRAVWAAYSNSTVARIDMQTSRVSARGYGGNTPTGISVSRNAVWVANFNGNSVSRLDPNSLEPATTAPITVGKGPRAIAVGGGAVWVANHFSDDVSRIDPQARAAMSIPVESGPTAIAFGYGSVWVANGDSGTVSRIDAKTKRVVATIKIGNSPAGIAVGAGQVWVTVQRA